MGTPTIFKAGFRSPSASDRAYNDTNYPNGFYLRAKADELELRGYRASDDWVWPATSLFAFVDNDTHRVN